MRGWICECLSKTTSAVPVGWDCIIDNPSSCLLLTPDTVRNNVMLPVGWGYDLREIVTSNLSGTWPAIYGLQEAVSIALQAPSMDWHAISNPIPTRTRKITCQL